MTFQVYFEVPIVLLSLSLWVTKLSQVYSAFVADVEVETSFIFFLMQLLLSTMWIICATMTMQWLVLITTCNSCFCQICIIYYLYKTKQRNHERYCHGFVKMGYISCEDARLVNLQHSIHSAPLASTIEPHSSVLEHVLASKICPLGLLH